MRRMLLFSMPSRQLFFGLVVALPLLAACSSGGGSNDAVDAANARNADKIDQADVTEKQEADATFLVSTTSNALLEVELGKLAQARATSPDVRSYGARLVQSRLELLAALRTLAEAKKLAVPPALGEDGQAAYHDVSTQPGTQLDKHLMALLVKAQKQDEDAFDDMKDDAYDGDLRGFAAKYLPAVQDLLNNAKDVNKVADDLP